MVDQQVAEILRCTDLLVNINPAALDILEKLTEQGVTVDSLMVMLTRMKNLRIGGSFDTPQNERVAELRK